MYIAIVGTRKPDRKMIHLAEHAAEVALASGFQLVTGGATGIDEVAMRVGHKACHVVLPWPSYNRHLLERYGIEKVTVYNPRIHFSWKASVWKYHPAAHRLDPPSMALHARNYGIVCEAAGIVALPKINSRGDYGGTGQAIRIAKNQDIPLLLLDDVRVAKENMDALKRQIERFIKSLEATSPKKHVI